MVLLFILTLLCFPVSTNDHVMNLDGTVGEFRFAMLSLNTLGEKVDTLATSGSDTHLIGSIEINLFNNVGSGSVYLSNYEYNNSLDIFTAINPNNSDSQIELRVDSDTNTNGTPSDPPRVITAEKKALLLTTIGEITNTRIIIDIYAKDSVNNVLTSDNYYANFSIDWED